MEKKTNFLEHPMVTAIIGTFVGTLIGSLIAASVTATNVEKSTVELMSKRLEIVEENDTLEEAINKVNKDVEEKEKEIERQSKEITELTAKVNDDTEIKKLRGELEDKQNEIDKIQEELENLKKEKDKLQEEKDELEEKGYEAYIKGKQSTAPISLSNISNMKNQDIKTDNVGDVSVNGTKISYYLDTGSEGEAFIEYNLDGKYSQFEGKAYISQWAYEYYDPSHSRITDATIILEVKYNDDDDYQVIDRVSGLIPDKDPTPIGGSLIGAKRLRIVFRGGAFRPISGGWYSIIRLGDPQLYKVNAG